MGYNMLMQPSETITPGSQPNQDVTEPEVNPAPAQDAQSQPGWTFSGDEQPPATSANSSVSPEVSWTASEYIAHDKGTGWFMGLAAATGLATVAVYLITQDIVTVIVVLVVAIVFGVFALRQPRVLSYKIDHSGITIADKHYPYLSFRSFAVQEEGAVDSILLIPLKRFMPGINIYFPPEQEDQIVGTLGNYLPHEDRPPDAIDRLMRKVRF